MPPRTRSMMIGEIHVDGEDKGAGPSDLVPGNDYMGMMVKMVKMVAELKNEMKGIQARMDASQNSHYEDLDELKGGMASIREEVTMLREARSTRPPTPKGDSIHLHVSEGNNEDDANYEWYEGGGREGLVGGNLENRFGHGNGWNDRFGHGNGMNEYVGDRDNQGRVGNYGGMIGEEGMGLMERSHDLGLMTLPSL